MQREIRHRIEYASWVTFEGLLRLLPLRAARFLGRNVGAALLRFGKLRRLMIANLRRSFPERSDRELAAIASRTARNLGGYFFEVSNASSQGASKLSRRFTVEGWETVERLRAANQSFLLITGHVGPFDLVVFPCAERLGRIHVVVHEQSNPYVRRRVSTVREKIGATLIPRHRAGARMLTLLRDGEPLGIAIDQRVAPWDGILIPFLGRYCWASPVPALVCRRTRSPAVPVFCLPDGADRYRLVVREPIWPRELGDDPTFELTRRHHQAIEEEILKAPDRWFWLHDRWRLVWRHSTEKALARLRRESGLPAGEPSRGAARDAERILPLLTRSRLEATRHAVLEGRDPEKREDAAVAAGRRTLENGYAVRFEQATVLARELEVAEKNGALQSELRRFDPFLLVIVTGALEAPAIRRRVRQLLEHRRDRGSVLVACELDAELHALLGEVERVRLD